MVAPLNTEPVNRAPLRLALVRLTPLKFELIRNEEDRLTPVKSTPVKSIFGQTACALIRQPLTSAGGVGVGVGAGVVRDNEVGPVHLAETVALGTDVTPELPGAIEKLGGPPFWLPVSTYWLIFPETSVWPVNVITVCTTLV